MKIKNILYILACLLLCAMGAMWGCGPEQVVPKGDCVGALDCPGSQLCISGKCISNSTESGQEVTTEIAAEPSTGESTTENPAAENPAEVTPGETPQETKSDASEGVVEESGTESFNPDSTPLCIDEDKDGYCGNIKGDRGVIDCNDNNDKIYPTAPELCNGVDDNCDGKIDEDLTPPPCTLAKGVCQGATKTCDGKNGWKDCSAADYDKHSNGAYQEKETSCDGVDNNCDGYVDETFAEKGTACTDATKKGECSRGTYECNAGKLECVATSQPKTEICNNSLDDDCDGQVDEGCVCTPGKTQACYPGTQGCTGSNGTYQCTAPCKAGTWTCGSNGQWGPCTGAVVAQQEVCDGIDNNCDGKIDETFPDLGRRCINGKGACIRSGAVVCDRTQRGTICSAVPGSPSAEICDGIDNDCDGQIDNGLRVFTYYQDLDNDGYGDDSVAKVACAAPKGFVSKGGDCYDKNPNAKPGQTAYFTTHRGDGSFDYDCDKVPIRQPLSCSTSCSGLEWSTSKILCGQSVPYNRCNKLITSCQRQPAGAALMGCR